MCLPLGSHCHTCSYFCAQIFCRETIRDHTKLLSFEFILNTTVSPCFLSRELLLQGFCHSWYPPTLMLVSNSWEYFPLAATAAKLLQSCQTLCDPIDGSPPGSAVPGILQARTLEWVAISFSNAWKWKVKVKSLSHQSIGVSISTSVLPLNSQNWSPLEWTGWISLLSKGLSRVFSNTTVQKQQFFSAQLSL